MRRGRRFAVYRTGRRESAEAGLGQGNRFPDYVQSSANGFFQSVIPAKAGIHFDKGSWIPAFAGMTGFRRACARISVDPGAQAELCA